MDVVVAVTGASGSLLAKQLLLGLKGAGVRTHLIMSEPAKKIAEIELPGVNIKSLADVSYSNNDLAAPIASGSFKFDAMIIAPCSMKTLGESANGCGGSLISRVVEVCLKEDRKLILMPREAPFSLIDLRNMVSVKEAGGMILPPTLAFYPKPETPEDLVNFACGKALDLLGIKNNLFKKWEGLKK